MLFRCFLGGGVISGFKTVLQHMLGQPFYNMSVEALEMMVKHANNLLCRRPAESGEDICVYIQTCV